MTAGRTLMALVSAAALLLVGCGPTNASPSPSTSVAAEAETLPPALPSPSGPVASPIARVLTTGFAVGAEDIAAFYQTRGYACGEPQRDSKAVGFAVRRCQETDEAGRTRLVGLVTDAHGDLADAFASVKGKPGETILAPIDALDPLAGFLGATLGEEQGASLLTWLASHLGDAHAETMSGPIKVTTYTASESDHSILYVQVANPAYIEAGGSG